MYTTSKSCLKRWARALSAILCGIILAGAISIQALAVDTASAVLSPGVTVKVDGAARQFFSATGAQVHPIIYSGTTYLPVRAIGELMDKNVNWDQSTRTVTLYGKRATPAVTGTPDANPTKQTVSVTLRQDFTIVLDGEEKTFRDVLGNRVYPMLYNGTTYLPLRAIGELMGKTVGWDPDTRTASLSGEEEDNLVTDADTFDKLPTPQPGEGSYIGESRAKSIALSHAGLTENQATFIKVKLSRDDGRWEYEVEFYSGNREYDYEIDAITGAVLDFDYDVDDWSPQPEGGTKIGVDKAKTLALGQAGLSGSQVTFTKARLCHNDGRWCYEVEFVCGNMEHKCHIDAYSGAVLEYEREHCGDDHNHYGHHNGHC